MEKYPDLFDRSIKEALKGHGLTPSGKARKAFLDEASTVLPARRSWKYWYLLPVVSIFLSAVVAFLWFENRVDRSAVGGQQSAVSGQQLAVLSHESFVDNKKEQISKSENKSSDNKHLTKQNPEIKEERTQNNTNTNDNTNDKQLVTINQEPISSTQQPVPATQQPLPSSGNNDLAPETRNQEPGANDQEPIPDTQYPIPDTQYPIPDTNINTNTNTNTNDQGLKTEDERWHIASGVYYNPEMMFNTLEDNKFVNNFGVEAIFYHGLVSIRTGVGLSVSKGITENSIDYNSYLGSYNKLDSVLFSYNENIHNFEPQIYTSSQKVWDTAVVSDYNEIVKRYTYLQVPLVLGFDFWQKDKISVGVRVGTIMSVMLASKQLTGEYDPGQNQVIGVNTLTPSQVSLNWQAVGGFAASAVLTKRISLEMEPQARYYYGSIYEKSGDVKKPWSVGIRLALLYKF
jgi:hypothetical protein